MHQNLSLNGKDWQCKPFYGEDWLLRQSHHPDTLDKRGWLPAQVPGSVQYDMLQAGEIPNLYFERNSLLSEWTAARSWVYKRSFRANSTWQDSRVRLRFHGVDYDARFFLNGEALGEHHDMYTPVTFEIGEQIKQGADNLISVVIDTARIEWPQIGYTSGVRTLKARMNYWWDFSPRVVHQGIWDTVELLVSGPAAIEDLWVRPRLKPGYAAADLDTQVTVSVLETATIEVEVTIRYNGECVAQSSAVQKMEAGQSTVPLTIAIDNPHLWWPNGYGTQNLYTAEASVRCIDCDGKEESDCKEVTFGIRDLKMIPNEGAADHARPYTVSVNGQRIYTRGWNWVPFDVLYGVERPNYLLHLLTLAKNANVTLLRVWGGGLIEKEAFYNLCDRFGILVWQEFIQSSSGIDNNAPSDPEFVAWVTGEARQIVPGRRNHPSLAIWCGGNELMSAPEKPLNDDHPMLAALKAVVNELDPDRLWLPTSSSGDVFSNALDLVEKDPRSLHDVHGPWEYQGLEAQYHLYNNTTMLFHSEFGAEGLTNRRTLDKVIAPEQQWPITLDNPVWFHLAAWWIKEKRWQEVFGEMSSVDDVQRATQFMQFEGVRYAIEANRRRSFNNSGSIPWQFNEPYPMASCTSAVDYYGEPKPMYYGVRNAYAPIAVTARYDRLAWAGHDTFEAELWAAPKEGTCLEHATMTWKLVELDGSVLAEGSCPVTTPDDHPQRVTAASLPVSKISGALFLLDVRLAASDGATLAENRYLYTSAATLAPIFALRKTTLEQRIQKEGSDWLVTLTNSGPQTALYVQLGLDRAPARDGWALFDHNYFCLLPGEARTVRVTWQGLPETEHTLAVWAWNI